MTRLTLFALGGLTISGCTGQVDEWFNVENDGAVLPVHARGNGETGTVVLFESGGPSGPGIAERLIDYVDFSDTLEQDALVVFYDRRGVGNAHGSYRDDDLTVDALTRDLHAVSEIVAQRYEPEHRVLVGHSFGGMSSLLYLLDHPDGADTWVPVAPGWTNSDEEEIHYRLRFACRVASEQKDAGRTGAIWDDILAFCDAHDEIEPLSETHDELWEYLNLIDNRFDDWPTMDAGGLAGAVFGSHYNFIDTQMRKNRISEPIFAELDGYEVLPALTEIEVPTLVVTGEFDTVGPRELCHEAVEALGASDKAYFEVEGAGHYPFHVDPEGFANQVLDFAGRR